MSVEQIQIQDLVLRAAVVVVIFAFVLGFVLRKFTRSGRAAARREEEEEANALKCASCGYYLVPNDRNCPKCGKPVGAS
jgi:hypothetical protein